MTARRVRWSVRLLFGGPFGFMTRDHLRSKPEPRALVFV
jgi:hypothetical protein